MLIILSVLAVKRRFARVEEAGTIGLVMSPGAAGFGSHVRKRLAELAQGSARDCLVAPTHCIRRQGFSNLNARACFPGEP